MPLPALTQQPFGHRVLHRIGTEDTHVSYVAAAAAYVHQVRLAGRDLLLQYPGPGALAANDGYFNLSLLPFPNRLLGGEYEWEGKSLAFAVNKPDTRSALHGLGLDVPFTFDRVDLTPAGATAHLSYLHRAADRPAAYPFDVRFDAALGVDVVAHAVTWSLTATNLGAGAAPVGLGWHPYFLLPGGRDAWSITMPPTRRVELERAIPTGRYAEGLPPKRATAVDPSWDDCFQLADPADRTVRLRGPGYGIELRQGGQTRYTQLFMPPRHEAIAIEPMTCNVDAFRQSPAEVRLAPGESVATSMQLSLTEGA